MISISLVHWRLLSRVAFVAAIIIVSWLAFSSDPPELTTRMSDKFNHVLAFFGLTFILDQTANRLPALRGLVVPLLAYGILIELVQGQLGYREMSWLDVGADSIGIILYLTFRIQWQRALSVFFILK